MFNYIENVKGNYVFKTVRKEKENFTLKSGLTPIDLSIGDYSAPIFKTVEKAYIKGVKEVAKSGAKFGYPPLEGYAFLKKKIAAEYRLKGADIAEDEIFITDGAKNDLFRISAVIGKGGVVLSEPAYPVYNDLSMFFGAEIKSVPIENCKGFIPVCDPFDGVKNGAFYLCSPSNPTGAAYKKEDFERVVEFANKSGSIIIYDGAYSCFLNGNAFETLYDLSGAKSCVIEVHTLSKCARFTNLRLGFTVIPNELKRFKTNYTRLLSSSFNGVSYPLARAGESVFSKNGKKEVLKNISEVKEKSAYLIRKIKEVTPACGGESSPYVYAKCPGGYTSIEFFKKLLYFAGVLGVPSSGFNYGGAGGEYIRFSAFAEKSDVISGAERIVKTYLSL